jgi:hypothetical protein
MPGPRFSAALQPLHANLALLPLVAAPLLFRVRREREIAFILSGFLAAAAAALLQGLLFGPARMDPPRPTTFLAVFAALAFCSILLVCALPGWLRVALGLLILSPPVAALLPRQLYPVGWGAASFEPARQRFLEIGAAEKLHRPFLGNVDLGAVSFHKQFNVVDLGFIGSDVVAKLNDPAMLADYLLEVARPDIVALGAHWACLYFFLERDARFKTLYQPLSETRGLHVQSECPQHPDVRDGLWLRRAIRAGSADPERKLIDDLGRGLDPGRVRAELAACSGKGPAGCLHVLRTVYRFLPEIRRAGLEPRFASLFEGAADPAFRAWSLALLGSRRDGRLSEEAERFIAALRHR